MSGHSKWSTIKHKKEKTDAQRARSFAKISREIAVCVRQHGADVNTNPKLRDLIVKARANNIPNENIERLLARLSGGQEKDDYEEIKYEGYGPSGIAIMVLALTDNRNRTAGDLRHYFDKFGGNLGQSGSVSFLFEEVGMITLEAAGLSEEALMQDLLETNAMDWQVAEDVAFVFVPSEELARAKNILETKYNVIDAGFEQRPKTYTGVENKEALEKLEKLLEALENNDDVQKVWVNLEVKEERR